VSVTQRPPQPAAVSYFTLAAWRAGGPVTPGNADWGHEPGGRAVFSSLTASSPMSGTGTG